MNFQADGSDVDLQNLRVESRIESYRVLGDSKIAFASSLFSEAQTQEQIEHADETARIALLHYSNSLNWAEDSVHEEDAHIRMDDAGKWVRQTFGCHLTQEDNSYFQTCPVALGHNRIGFSIGAIANKMCSLCSQDLSECEHLPGVAYLVPGGSEDLGHCRVCLSETPCEHLPTLEYRVSVVGIIVTGELLEVSIVNKPALPEARIQKLSLSNRELMEFLGEKFQVGMAVSCDRCLSSCEGLQRHEAFSLHL